MNTLATMPDEALAALHAQTEAALRLAAFHGAEVPERAAAALRSIEAELERRGAIFVPAPTPTC